MSYTISWDIIPIVYYYSPLKNCKMIENKNVFLYWNNEVTPRSVQCVYERWRKFTQGWNVEIFNRITAAIFLKDNFGPEVSELFLSCRMPAMQADVFRVFVVLAQGGIYSDVTYQPKRMPDFFSEKHNITAVKSWQGQFTNSVFFGRQGCNELERVSQEILRGLRHQESNKIWALTGPGAWFRAIAPHNNPEVHLLFLPDLMRTHLHQSKYDASTRGTLDHWSERQKTESIFFTQRMSPDSTLS